MLGKNIMPVKDTKKVNLGLRYYFGYPRPFHGSKGKGIELICRGLGLPCLAFQKDLADLIAKHYKWDFALTNNSDAYIIQYSNSVQKLNFVVLSNDNDFLVFSENIYGTIWEKQGKLFLKQRLAILNSLGLNFSQLNFYVIFKEHLIIFGNFFIMS